MLNFLVSPPYGLDTGDNTLSTGVSTTPDWSLRFKMMKNWRKRHHDWIGWRKRLILKARCRKTRARTISSHLESSEKLLQIELQRYFTQLNQLQVKTKLQWEQEWHANNLYRTNCKDWRYGQPESWRKPKERTSANQNFDIIHVGLTREEHRYKEWLDPWLQQHRQHGVDQHPTKLTHANNMQASYRD